jgi:methyl-accepting chemotaxis protein
MAGRWAIPLSPVKRYRHSIGRLTPGKLFNSLSVRARIAAIAILPLVGFFANDFAFIAGESEVDDAFRSAHQAAEVADSSREFKVALTAMRMNAREFAADPSYEIVTVFGIANDDAMRALDVIDGTGVHASEIRGLREKVAALKMRFSDLIREQETLGFSDTKGLQGRLNVAGANIECVIAGDLAWIPAAKAQKLLISIEIMRRYESLYRQQRVEAIRQQFADEFINFKLIFNSVASQALPATPAPPPPPSNRSQTRSRPKPRALTHASVNSSKTCRRRRSAER